MPMRYYTAPNATGAFTVTDQRDAKFYGYICPTGVSTMTLDVYDNASAASGQKLMAQVTLTTAGKDILVNPVRVHNGITANIGTAAPGANNLIILWEP